VVSWKFCALELMNKCKKFGPFTKKVTIFFELLTFLHSKIVKLLVGYGDLDKDITDDTSGDYRKFLLTLAQVLSFPFFSFLNSTPSPPLSPTLIPVFSSFFLAAFLSFRFFNE